MNNPYLLKKQLQDNEEELSSYLRSMKVWQEQMKRKDTSPYNKPDEKKKKNNTNGTYNSQNMLYADKPCKKLNEQNELNTIDSDSSTDDSSNELQSKLSEGLYEKNLGNALVQKQKWAEAILRYTRAIEYYDKDPIFYANRALCYLKTKEFNHAITDCSSSLKLDNSYVKAYQRRCSAYISLEMYNEAKKDLNEILKLEPNNKQAKLDIEVVNKKIQKNSSKKNSDLKIKETNSLSNHKCKNFNSNILCNDVEESVKCVIPEWPSRTSCKQIISLQKPPHLRSKKPLCTLKIKDIQTEDLKTCDDLLLLQNTLKEVFKTNQNENKLSINNQNINSKEDKNIIKTGKEYCLVVPPSPKTYVQLKQDWAYLKSDSKLLFQYLKKISGKQLPLIVGNSMDSDLFVDIMKTLKSEFVTHGHTITDYLLGISELPRLQMLVMFCSDDEILCIKELLNYVSKSLTENDFKSLKKSFGV